MAALRARLAAADAVLFCTPEYAGALPGSFKNLLEWTVGGEEIYRLPAAWVNAAQPGSGPGSPPCSRRSPTTSAPGAPIRIGSGARATA